MSNASIQEGLGLVDSQTLSSSKQGQAGLGLRFIFGLAVFSVFLAPGPQYVCSFAWLVWFVGTRAWRDVDASYAFPVRTMVIGSCVAALFAAVSALLFWAGDEDGGLGLSKHLYELWHLMGKSHMRGLLALAVILAGYKRGLSFYKIAPVFFLLMSINVIYMVVQRYTGIDWIHGFDAVLPPNRFANGVFRSSGFTAHPLSLGYGAMMMATVGLAMFWPKSKKPQFRSIWFGLFATSSMVLLLTQSRWPFAIVVGLVVLRVVMGWSQGLAQRTKLALLGLLTVVAIGFAGGFAGRYEELLRDHASWQERVPRLVFWQAHWEMVLDHPLLGVGYVNRETAREAYYAKIGHEDFGRKYSAHNIYLQTLADSGLVGFLGFVSFLGAILVMARDSLRRGSLGIILFLVATLLAGLLQNTFRDSEYLFGFWVSLALLVAEIYRTADRGEVVGGCEA